MCELEKLTGTPRETIQYRLDRGMPVEEAATKKPFHGREVELDGIVRTIPEWSREHGIDVRVVSDRLRLGWGFKEALTVPNNGRGSNRWLGRKFRSNNCK